MRNDQNGFGIVSAIIVVIVVGVVGAAAFQVWKSQKPKDNHVTTVQRPDSTKQPSQTGRELVFDAWGVRLPLKGQDTFTTILQEAGPNEYYAVYNGEITKQCEDATVKAATVTRATLTAKTVNGETYDAVYAGQQGGTEFNRWKKLGSYIYIFNSPQTGCAASRNPDGTANALGLAQNKIVASFIASSNDLYAK